MIFIGTYLYKIYHTANNILAIIIIIIIDIN